MYTPAKERYNIMEYNRCGRSGLLLPKISLGLWHNYINQISTFRNDWMNTDTVFVTKSLTVEP